MYRMLIDGFDYLAHMKQAKGGEVLGLVFGGSTSREFVPFLEVLVEPLGLGTTPTPALEQLSRPVCTTENRRLRRSEASQAKG